MSSKVVRKSGANAVVKPGPKTAARKRGAVVKKAAGAKPAVSAKAASAHILSAPDGYRTLTHDQIKQAVESVFAKRYSAR